MDFPCWMPRSLGVCTKPQCCPLLVAGTAVHARGTMTPLLASTGGCKMQARHFLQTPPTTATTTPASSRNSPLAADLRPISRICYLFPRPPPNQGRESGLCPAPRSAGPCDTSHDPLWPQQRDVAKEPKGMSGCVTPSLPSAGSRLCGHSPLRPLVSSSLLLPSHRKSQPAPSLPPSHCPGPGLFLLPTWTLAEPPNPSPLLPLSPACWALKQLALWVSQHPS